MSDREFGVYMMENLELLVPLLEELHAIGKPLPEIAFFCPTKIEGFL
jgi:hypothetical protein